MNDEGRGLSDDYDYGMMGSAAAAKENNDYPAH